MNKHHFGSLYALQQCEQIETWSIFMFLHGINVFWNTTDTETGHSSKLNILEHIKSIASNIQFGSEFGVINYTFHDYSCHNLLYPD